MTTNDDSQRCDDFVSDLIDGDPTSPADESARFTPDELERVADLQLVHSLLVRARAGQDEVIDREARIRAVMTRMRTQPMERPFRLAPVLGGMVRSRSVQLATAACLLIAVSIGWLIRTESSAVAARAAVAQAMAESEVSRDRTYTVAFLAGEQTIKQGVLRLRGSDRFVFERPTPDGDKAYVGRDEQGLWTRAPQWLGGEVQRPDDERQMRRWLRDLDAPMPFLTMGNTLRDFSEHYRTTEHADDPITGLYHIRGVRKQTDLSAPDLVELWLDRKSGVVHRIELGWSEALRAKIQEKWRERFARRMQQRQQAADTGDDEARRHVQEFRRRMEEHRRTPDGKPQRGMFRHPHRILIELVDEAPLDDAIFRPTSYR